MLEFAIILFGSIAITLFVQMLFPRGLLQHGEAAEEEPSGLLYQIKPLLTLLGKLNAWLPLADYKKRLQKKMVAAGEPFGVRLTADEFMALSELVGVSGGFLFYLLFGPSFSRFLLGASFGYMLPYAHVHMTEKNRKQLIRRQLPDFLDLLTLTVEAGLDFNAALAKILKRSKRTPLIDEFKIMMQEIKLGSTRREALKAVAERVDVPDFRGFVSALLQADQLGTSLAPTLRIQSDQMRKRRLQMAEKAGGEASVKLLIPLIFLIFPAVFIMLLGPLLLEFLAR